MRFMEIAFMPGCQVDLRHNMPLRLCGNAISQLTQGSPNSFESTNLKIGRRKLGETKLVKRINTDLSFAVPPKEDDRQKESIGNKNKAKGRRCRLTSACEHLLTM